jgi:hypothetical protein
MNAYYFRHVPLFACAILLLAAPARAVTITDFGGNTSASGGVWTWIPSTKTLQTFDNTSGNYLFQTSGAPLADITGGQFVSITGNLVLSDTTGPGDFTLRLSNNSTTIATASFSYSQFAGGPITVTSPLTFTGGTSNPIIDQWYIEGNGNPATYLGEITFTEMVVSVPEPSTCAMALAGLACGGYSLFRRRKRA